MTSRYRHRRTSNPATAFPDPIEPGELAINTANRQLAVGDAESSTIGAPLALLAVRVFDARAKYAAGDFVVQAGTLYRAKVAVSPGAFNSANWDSYSGDSTWNSLINEMSLDIANRVAKTGDTMSGLLVLSADPSAALGAATKQYVDSKVGGAPINSPTFTGDPKAPTPSANDNDTSIATTAFVIGQASISPALALQPTAAVGTSTRWARHDHVHPSNFTSNANTLAANTDLNGVTQQGYYVIPNPTNGPNAPGEVWGYHVEVHMYTAGFVVQIAWPMYVTPPQQWIRNCVNGTWSAWTQLAGSGAPINSPAFTGDPTAPTPATADNDTSIATTAFVKAQGYLGEAPNDGGWYARGSLAWQNIGTLFAPMSSPVFSGDPRAPTPATADSDTSIATTAFVKAAIVADTTKAPVASPAFTGNPTAPNQTLGDNDTSIANTAFVQAALAAFVPSSIADGAVSTAAKIADGIITFAKMATAALATTAEYLANTANKILTTDKVWAAAVPVGAVTGSSFTPDFGAGIDFIYILNSATSTLNNPTNMKPGQKGVFYVCQDGTGSRQITTWGNKYKFSSGQKPTLTNVASSVDVISYAVVDANQVFCFFTGDVR